MQPKTFSVFSVPPCFELYLMGLLGEVRAAMPCEQNAPVSFAE
jgi:hypothetical protein